MPNFSLEMTMFKQNTNLRPEGLPRDFPQTVVKNTILCIFRKHEF